MVSPSTDNWQDFLPVLKIWRKLTPRQQEIFWYRANGLHPARIARALNVHRSTVGRNIKRITKLLTRQAHNG